MEIITFDQLNKMYEDNLFIPYTEYLRTNEWLLKRGKILARDNFTCQKCGKTETIDHYDENLRKTFYLWFGQEEWVRLNNMDEVAVPKVSISDKRYHLEIHHKFYIENRLPWNYDDDDLVTLCNWCHKEWHQNNDIELYTDDKLNKIRLDPCKRCDGMGWFEVFKHINNGVCFECNGRKFKQTLIKRTLNH